MNATSVIACNDAQRRQELADQYSNLRRELISLHSQPSRDPLRIEATMNQIDAVQLLLKALNGRPDDPQRF